MNLIKQGKTKDVYSLDNGNILLKFKDTVTGDLSTGTLDPGGNQVVGEIKDTGLDGLRVTKYYFELLKKRLPKIKTHYIEANLTDRTMTVVPGVLFGKGIEVVIRFIATGSFIRRYGDYIKDGESLVRTIGGKKEALIEFTLKDDKRDDPPITETSLIYLNLLSKDEIEQIKAMAEEVAFAVLDDLKEKKLDLYDIKFEFARDKNSKEVMLVDEISSGVMRVYKDGKKLNYADIGKYF